MGITREIWRARWLSSINELTSKSLQINSWLDKSNTNPHWSFVEFMCSYFDDLLIHDYEYYLQIGWISEIEYGIINDWHTSLDKYESPNKDDYNHDAILSDSKWLEILNKGQKVKDKLSEILPPEENQILFEDIDYLKYR